VLPIFVSHHSSAILRVTRLIDFMTQLNAVLHAGSLVSCHNSLSPVHVSIDDLNQEYRYVRKCNFTVRQPTC
jgi:hypothetical protein